MKWTERIVIIAIFVVLFGGGWLFFAEMEKNHAETVAAVERGDFEIREETQKEETVEEVWRRHFPTTVPIQIGGTQMYASVADDIAERIKGLSDTPVLPLHIVKLFAFGAPGNHSIWMKDMNYSLDIIWVAEDGEIVHIEENISPDTYPTSFSSPIPSWFVIEANAGFVANNSIKVGDTVTVDLTH